MSIGPRDDFPDQAQASWRDPRTRKRQRRRITGITLAADGKTVDRAQRTLLHELALLLHRRLREQRAMPGDPAGPSWSALISEAAPAKPSRDEASKTPSLTVREALAIAYGPSYANEVNGRGRISAQYVNKIKGKQSGGAAISTWTRQARDLRRLADVAEAALGPDEPWDWTEASYTRLRDALIEQVRRGASSTQAPHKLRRVHKVLQTYIRATRVVQKALKDDEGARARPKALTIERWLTDLKAAWEAVGLPLPDEEQARYDKYEAAQIYVEGTTGESHDPRYGLWLILGMEGRPVQILRARRSHLEDKVPDTPRGVFRGPGASRKHGLTYAPTPAHRIAIEKYLRHGYLREYEERYLKKQISDYPLFPTGAVVDGRIPFVNGVRPWGYRQFLGSAQTATGFYAIEKAAGVPNLAGRGPYGLKYAVADLVPAVAGKLGIADAVAINLATAHDTPGSAPQYRRKARAQSSVLIDVGKLVWGVRKELRDLGPGAFVESLVRLPVARTEVIADYLVSANGVTLRLASEARIFVPWQALALAGENELGVSNLRRFPAHREQHEVDDDGRAIRFRVGGPMVVLRLDTMRDRAYRNESRDPDDAVEL